MSVVMIGDWGRSKEGVFKYSVNTTTRADMQLIIDAIIASGAEFYMEPEIGYKAKTFHCLLEFFVPHEDEHRKIVI